MTRRKGTRGQARKHPCPVARLAAEHDRVVAIIDEMQDLQLRAGASPSAKCRAARRERVADDRRRGIWEAASFEIPTSPAGALFQIALASSDMGEDASEPRKEREVRRGHRLLYAVARYLKSQGGQLSERNADFYMRTDNDPHPGAIPGA
jgi:hypothetical protein